MGDHFVPVTAIPPVFFNSTWLYVTVDSEHPEHLVALRVFRNSSAARYGVRVVRELMRKKALCDFIVPVLRVDSTADDALCVYEEYCFHSMRVCTSLTMDLMRTCLFQALFVVDQLQRECSMVHGNLHAGNILFLHDPFVRGRTYSMDDCTWCVLYSSSLRFSDFSHAWRSPNNWSDVVDLEKIFTSVTVEDGSPLERAMLADVLQKMRDGLECPLLLKHDFFYELRVFISNGNTT